ncbi:MAG: ABC transporter permease [Pyrinomonadaceae bacterium]
MISSNNPPAAVETPNNYQTRTSDVLSSANPLPDKPLIVIEPSRSWVALNLRDLWHYRDLLYILTERDIKVRYKQTALGAAWAIIQPLFTMLIFTVFFGNLAGLPSDGVPYPLFAYAGLLPWTFFSNAVTNSGNSLVGNSNLITKVYFPRMVIPIAAVGSGLVDFAVAFVLLVGLIIYYAIGFSLSLLMLPVLVLLTATLAIGIGMWMSALNVKYRDIRYALPFFIQLGMFASGIITPIPERWRFLLFLNPLAAQIQGYRAAIFGRPFDWTALGISALVTVAVLVYSAYNFRRMEKSFADVV